MVHERTIRVIAALVLGPVPVAQITKDAHRQRTKKRGKGRWRVNEISVPTKDRNMRELSTLRSSQERGSDECSKIKRVATCGVSTVTAIVASTRLSLNHRCKTSHNRGWCWRSHPRFATPWDCRRFDLALSTRAVGNRAVGTVAHTFRGKTRSSVDHGHLRKRIEKSRTREEGACVGSSPETRCHVAQSPMKWGACCCFDAVHMTDISNACPV